MKTAGNKRIYSSTPGRLSCGADRPLWRLALTLVVVAVILMGFAALAAWPIAVALVAALSPAADAAKMLMHVRWVR